MVDASRRPARWDAPVLAFAAVRQATFTPSRLLLALDSTRTDGSPKTTFEVLAGVLAGLAELASRRRWRARAERASRELGAHVTYAELMTASIYGDFALSDGRQLLVRHRSTTSPRVLIALN